MSVNFQGQQPNNFPSNSRLVIDANYVQNVTLPSGGNVANTNAINFPSQNPPQGAYPTTETVSVMLITGAATNTANNVAITACLQQTSTNTDGTANTTNWVNVPLLNAVLLTSADNNNTGNPGANVIFKFPAVASVPQYIRAQFNNGAGGGANTAGTGTLQLVF